MTTRKLRCTIGAACLVIFLAVTLAWAGAGPTPFRTGLFGVTAEQIIRVSVLNAGDDKGTIKPRVKIWDLAGNVLFEADGDSLVKGRGTFVDFIIETPGFIPETPGQGRKQLRAEVDLEGRDASGKPRLVHASDVIITLEVFDTATGKTAFTMPFAARAGIEPTPFTTALPGVTGR